MRPGARPSGSHHRADGGNLEHTRGAHQRAPAPAAPPLAAQPKGVALGKLPTFIPIQGQAPDLPGTPDGLVSPGWIKYPKSLFQAVKDPPGAGGDVTITVETNNPPWPPLEQNAQLQALSKAMNARLNVIHIPFADFDPKWATIQASNDLPDLMCTITRPSTPIVPAFLDAKCTDLTPYLAGDAIRDYPNLAAIPTRSWKGALVNGKIYGVPIPLRPYFWWFWVHKEILDQLGVGFPKSAAEFKDTALKVNKPQENVWALGSEGGAQYAFSTINGLWNSVFKAPNYWSVDASGKFTYVFETPEYKQAMVYAADLFKAGLYHPNSLAFNTLSARTDFMARKMIFRLDGLQSSPYWGGYNAQPMEPASHITLVPPFSADGQTKPVYYFGRPNFGITLVKKASDARVKEMLRLLNFIASPFGSQEYQLLFYGVEGKSFNYDDQGNPGPHRSGPRRNRQLRLRLVQPDGARSQRGTRRPIRRRRRSIRATKSCWRRWVSRTRRSARSRPCLPPRARFSWTPSATARRTSSPAVARLTSGTRSSRTGRTTAETRSRPSWRPHTPN